MAIGSRGIGALSGAAGGGLSGAALGSSIFPGPGTAIGAGLGALAGGLGGLFGGTKRGRFDRPSLTPEEQSIFGSLLGQGQNILSNPYQGFQPVANRAQSLFQQQTVPAILERLTGAGGALSSPALATQLGQAGAGLSEALAELEAQYGMQNRNNALQMLQLGLSPYQNQFYRPTEAGFGGQLFGSGASMLPLLAESLKGQDLSSNWNNFFGRRGRI